MSASADAQYMARAIRLAGQGLYSARPNPRVGCVLVRDDEVLAEGAHLQAGGPHAEVVALRQAGPRARGATVYVTLEPCAHHGRTPPCADALIEAGVGRVVVAMQDPNPRVAGSGIERLRAAGIAVETGLQEDAARSLNPGFNKRMQAGLPLVRVKMAMSLDARTAMASGESQWITGPSARDDVQRLRARSCAVVTGVGTVLADDPRLTVRTAGWLDDEAAAAFLDAHQPLRVVVDSKARTPAGARLFAEKGAVLIACNSEPEQPARGADYVTLPDGGAVDLAGLLRYLAQRDCNEVLVEAGPRLAGAFLRAGLVDEIWIYQAPVLLGHEARPAFELADMHALADGIGLQVLDQRMLGRDQRIIAKLARNGG